MATLFGMFPFLKTLSPTADIRGRNLRKGLQKFCRISTLKSSNVPIRSRICGLAKTLDRRAHHCMAQSLRRLAKDWENLNRKALAFLRLASIRLMLRKLCNPA